MSLQVMSRSGTRRSHLRMPDLQISCRGLSIRKGTGVITPSLSSRYQLLCKAECPFFILTITGLCIQYEWGIRIISAFIHLHGMFLLVHGWDVLPWASFISDLHSKLRMIRNWLSLWSLAPWMNDSRSIRWSTIRCRIVNSSWSASLLGWSRIWESSADFFLAYIYIYIFVYVYIYILFKFFKYI